jgi:nucleotide-binding universal stress UspA family protein
MVLPPRMLLVVDGTREAEIDLRVLAELAKATGSELHLVCIASTKPSPPFPHSWEESGIEEIKDQKGIAALTLLEEKAGRAQKLGVRPAGTRYREGGPKEVVRLAGELGAELIVVGDRNSGPFGSLIGRSFWRELRRRAPCPVLAVSQAAETSKARARPGRGAG